MKNAKICAIVYAILFAVYLFPIQLTAEVEATTISFLKSSQQSAWTTMALAAMGESNISTEHLKTVEGNTVNDYAKAILAIASLKLDPRTFGNVDYVAQIKTRYNASQLGDVHLLNDDMWGILALSASGENKNTNEIQDAKNYLLNNQNNDGGFSYAPGNASDTNSTAAALLAFIEAGLDSQNQQVTKAINYLSSSQNSDGGFPYMPSDVSDTNSTAWVVWAIKKVGQDPVSWKKDSKDPIQFIQSMKNSDGSFGWTKEFPEPNIFATHDATIALSGKTIPIDYFPASINDAYHLRIEGKGSQICDAFVQGITAFDLLKNGAEVCQYTYEGKNFEGLGFLLTKINSDQASGFASWMYLINNIPAQTGLETYKLLSNDDILIYFDEDYRSPAYPDYDHPLRLLVRENIVEHGKNLFFTTEYFNSGNWVLAKSVKILGLNQEYTTNDNGVLEIVVPDGYYRVAAEKVDFIRSEKHIIQVGLGVSQKVNMDVEIEGGVVSGESIVFEVNPSQIHFKALRPGQSDEKIVSLANNGSVNLAISTVVSGDDVFINNILLNNSNWKSFSSILNSGENKNTTLKLKVPENFIGSGIKQGELVFWAQAQ